MTPHTPHAAVFLTNGQLQRVFVGDFTDCTNEVLKWESDLRNRGSIEVGGDIWYGDVKYECEIFEAETPPLPTTEQIRARLKELREKGLIPPPEKTEWQLLSECTAMLNQTGEAYGLYRCSVFYEPQNEENPWICEVIKFDYDGRESVLISVPGETPLQAVQEIHTHISEWATNGKIPQ